MPAGTVQANHANYYKIRKTTYQNQYGKEVEGNAIVKWNGIEEEFVDLSFGGHLASVKVGEKKNVESKEGKSFTVQDCFYEFHSFDTNGELLREIIAVPVRSKINKSLISKLSYCESFDKINFKLGLYKKNNGDVTDTLSVWDKEIHLSTPVLPRFVYGEEWKTEDEQVVLPKKRYLKKSSKGYDITEDWNEASEDKEGRKMIDDSWYDEVNNLFLEAIDKYIVPNLKDLAPYKKPETPADVTGEQETSSKYPINGNKKEEKPVTPNEELPEISMEDIDSIQMPF